MNKVERDEFFKDLLMKARIQFEKRSNGNVKLTHLHNFVRLKTLDVGKFGSVLLARQDEDQMQTYHKIKVIEKNKVIMADQLSYSLGERAILSSVDFPFIIKLEGTFKDNANLYMILENTVGGDLFLHLKHMGRMVEDLVRFYAAQVVLSVQYLHNLKIVHRNLKPETVFLDEHGFIKVSDFWFAKVVTTRTYTLCGSPDYLAPEMILGLGHYQAVDWWALGVLIYEMVAGYPPFFAMLHIQSYEKICEGNVHFPFALSKDGKDLVKNLLQVDLTKRFGNLKDGVKDILNHNWFATTDWVAVYEKKVPCPFVPKVKGPGDTRYFDRVDEYTIPSSEYDLFTEEFSGF